MDDFTNYLGNKGYSVFKLIGVFRRIQIFFFTVHSKKGGDKLSGATSSHTLRLAHCYMPRWLTLDLKNIFIWPGDYFFVMLSYLNLFFFALWDGHHLAMEGTCAHHVAWIPKHVLIEVSRFTWHRSLVSPVGTFWLKRKKSNKENIEFEQGIGCKVKIQQGRTLEILNEIKRQAFKGDLLNSFK